MAGQDQTAVVVGAGSGIGRALALALAHQGWRVVAADIDPLAAVATHAQIEATNGWAAVAAVDATDPAQLDKLSEAIPGLLGTDGVNLLAVTVGAVTNVRLADASDADWQWMLEMNLMASVRTVNALLPRLRAASARRQILLTGALGSIVEPAATEAAQIGLGPYVASKHALAGYAGMLRHELAPEGIEVTLALPTRVQGNLGQTSMRHRPERHGGPRGQAAAPVRDGLMPANLAAERILAAVEQGRAYAFTHPSSHAALAAHWRPLEQDAAALQP